MTKTKSVVICLTTKEYEQLLQYLKTAKKTSLLKRVNESATFEKKKTLKEDLDECFSMEPASSDVWIKPEKEKKK